MNRCKKEGSPLQTTDFVFILSRISAPMRYLLIVIISFFFFAGCKKDTPPRAVTPNTELLTAKPWLYNEYYSGYGTPSQKRLYKRNNPGNSVDFSEYQYIFYKDGSFVVKIGRESLNGSWKFINNETGIEISSASGSPTVLSLHALNNNSFDWVMDEYFAKMTPQ